LAYTIPAVSDFKAMFFRDFPYGGTNGDLTTVQDQDIVQGINDAGINFNPNLFADQSSFNTGYLLLSAHFMVLNLRNSSQGINGQYPWMQSSKSVGSVSESFQIPQRILDNPEYAMLSKTTYGSKFLFLVLPQLTGQMFSVCGRTNA
jgi:hypothetical protein